MTPTLSVPTRATPLRLLADDLTGALDTAAQFSGLHGGVRVRFRAGDTDTRAASLAYDTESRNLGPEEASARLAALAHFFDGAGIAFKKVDSLLRGHAALELAAVLRAGRFASAVIAPAFPAQGRVTRGGIQRVRGLDGRWTEVRREFARELAEAGIDVRAIADPALLRGRGVFLCDADTDADLAAIVAAATGLEGRVLWCGSAGLAAALAGRPPARKPVPPEPLLAIVGSHHPVMRAQIERLDDVHPELSIALREGGLEVEEVRACLAERGAAVVRFALPDYRFAAEASRRIAGMVAALLEGLDAPAGLFVSGGDTLRAVAGALGAQAFEIGGEVAPGLPSSRIVGGRWDGVRVVSKSGAFGDADLLVRLVGARGDRL